MNYKYKASILIVNYNGKKYNSNLFESLSNLNTSKSDFEIIYRDNASTDGSVDDVKKIKLTSDLNIKIIDGKENLGFAGGNNSAAEEAEGEYLVLLNNDTKVDSEWLNELIKAIDGKDEIGIVNSKLLFFYDFIRFDINSVEGFHISNEISINNHKYILDPKFTSFVLHKQNKNKALCYDSATIFLPLLDGICDYEFCFDVLDDTDEFDFISLDFDLFHVSKGKRKFKISKENILELKETLIQNAGSKINEFNDGEDIGFGKIDNGKYDNTYEIDSACGASMILRKNDWDKLKGFDERFFMYYEDSDLSYRMKSLGKKLMYCPTSIVRHIHTGSSTEWSKFFLYHVIRNKLLFIYKNKSEKEFKKEYYHNIISALRERYKVFIRIKAARDAMKIIKGKSNIHF